MKWSMKATDRDLAYLWDIVNAGYEIISFVKGLDINSFASDKKTRYAVERQITVIGEAARRISAEFKEANLEIPWSGIVSQRNVIVHEYGEIKTAKIWTIAKEKIPQLVNQLEPFIPEDDRPQNIDHSNT